MSELLAYIKSEIVQNGPISLARYMELCLTHPKYGYYMTRDPFGAQGDFITAPEVSQVFGELVGAWCVDGWVKIGAPDPVALIELGPGRGTLMKDFLNGVKKVQAFTKAVHLHLVEGSPILKKAQSQTLRNYAPQWHDGPKTLPNDAPLIIIANEFLDALPVHQFIKTKNGWDEVVVGLSSSGDLKVGQQEAAPHLVKMMLEDIPQAKNCPEKSCIEYSPAVKNYLQNLFQALQKQSGFCLFIDYGYEVFQPQKTVQAVHKHRSVSLLEHPGEVDLTAHVNFETVGQIARQNGLHVLGITSQKDFLERLGIGARLAALANNATVSQKKSLEAVYERLCGIDQMGELFKVIAISSDPDLKLEGFSCA